MTNNVDWVDECPPWCIREHGEGVHPEDNYHQSEPIDIPAAILEGYPSEYRSATLEITVTRRHDQHWLEIAEPEGQYRVLGVGSTDVPALLAAMTKVLELVAA